MRSEQEMYDLILGIAQQDPRIRAVYMNGSRVNDAVSKDLFQDYDIVYVVEQTAPFWQDKGWIDQFGQRLYMQCPEEGGLQLGMAYDLNQNYGWLMQFADGNRIDLHVQSVDYGCQAILTDKLCKILLDKEEILPAIPPSTDVDYWVKCPNQMTFSLACNEFWWCLNNVAKGLFREEIPYVQDMLNLIRGELIKVLTWKIGLDTNFSVSVGKSGKYLKNHLSQPLYERLMQTYCGGDLAQLWQASFTMCLLFDDTAAETARRLRYAYDFTEAQNSMGFLHRVHGLDRDAQKI